MFNLYFVIGEHPGGIYKNQIADKVRFLNKIGMSKNILLVLFDFTKKFFFK